MQRVNEHFERCNKVSPPVIEFCLIKIHQAENTMCKFSLLLDEEEWEKEQQKFHCKSLSTAKWKSFLFLLTINGIFSMNELWVWSEELLSFWSGFCYFPLANIYTMSRAVSKLRMVLQRYIVLLAHSFWNCCCGNKSFEFILSNVSTSSWILHHKNFFCSRFCFGNVKISIR